MRNLTAESQVNARPFEGREKQLERAVEKNIKLRVGVIYFRRSGYVGRKRIDKKPWYPQIVYLLIRRNNRRRIYYFARVPLDNVAIDSSLSSWHFILQRPLSNRAMRLHDEPVILKAVYKLSLHATHVSRYTRHR